MEGDPDEEMSFDEGDFFSQFSQMDDAGGSQRDAALQAGNSLHTFTKGGVTRLKDLMHLEKGCWKPAVELAETLAVWSVRMCEQFLWHVKGCLPPSVLELIEETLAGGYWTIPDLEWPTFWVGLSVQPKHGWVTRGDPPLPVRFHGAEKKLLNNWSVRVVHAASFQTLPTSKWSEHFEEAHLSSARDARPTARRLSSPWAGEAKAGTRFAGSASVCQWEPSRNCRYTPTCF
ncbi:hypothetical protein SKAU_G00103700 [Synaphobranchus kaupii]|uniref:Uncharacterized protein n=1 Tax=Synaphobranchus kaupii TaxID=118154 RepID=A0A9Q1FZP7_SYNKA|nr:hypothetical protein SKAU_G00103700 [Synaphobranchus kaupii]